jgi:hypothetical protein
MPFFNVCEQYTKPVMLENKDNLCSGVGDAVVFLQINVAALKPEK